MADLVPVITPVILPGNKGAVSVPRQVREIAPGNKKADLVPVIILVILPGNKGAVSVPERPEKTGKKT